MQLQYEDQSQQTQESTYDLETIGKVTRLAERLQSRDKEAWSAAEIESMGAEVGLRPEFIRQALGKVEEERKVTTAKPKQKASPETLKAWRNAWWAGGWMFAPLALFAITNVLGLSEVTQGLGLFLGVPLYVGLGVYLNSIAKGAAKATAPPFSRADMLRTLEQYRANNEPQELTVLSVAPAVPLDPQELEALQQWIRTSCRAFRSDGEVICGAAMEITFRSGEDAASAARTLQEALATQATLDSATTSGRLRCGLATGFEFERVRQQASALQQAALADDILVDRHTAGGALPALDHLTELPGKVAGGTVFSWRSPRAT
jgi:hypothetical protein